MKPVFTLLFLAFSFPALGADKEASKQNYWPGWLGSKRDGWVKGFEPLKKWPAKLNQVWQLKVGEGYGTALVVRDHVYQPSRMVRKRKEELGR